jgi:hypothetical protein
VNLFRAFFYGRALSAKGDPKLALVGGFGLQKRPRWPGDYPAYIPAESNQGWHEEWFYIRNPTGNPFPSFTGAHRVMKESWTWGGGLPQRRCAWGSLRCCYRSMLWRRALMVCGSLAPCSPPGRPIGSQDSQDVGIHQPYGS